MFYKQLEIVKMKRHYYVSEDLNDLKAVEQELEKSGLTTPQLHVLSEKDAEVEKHHLHAIKAVLKQDVVHSTQLGAIVVATFWLSGGDCFRLLHLGRWLSRHSNSSLSIQTISSIIKAR
jgi:hypothetical protein